MFLGLLMLGDMNIYIVDDMMIKSGVDIDELSYFHLDLVPMRFIAKQEVIVYNGVQGCKILKSRFLTFTEEYFGRIFPKERFKKFIQEVIVDYE